MDGFVRDARERERDRERETEREREGEDHIINTAIVVFVLFCVQEDFCSFFFLSFSTLFSFSRRDDLVMCFLSEFGVCKNGMTMFVYHTVQVNKQTNVQFEACHAMEMMMLDFNQSRVPSSNQRSR